MTFRIWKKKIVSLSYFLFVGSCFKERNRFGADFFQKNFSFCRKRVPEGQFPSPRMTFPFKGRPIDFVFFFSGINGKSFSPSRRRIEQRSLPFCYETFRYESGKIVLLYYFLTMLWIISNSALPFTVSLNRCYRKRAVYDTTFRWKANSKTAHHYRKITERGTIAKQKSRH